jgi:catabolite regulation protein CreA
LLSPGYIVPSALMIRITLSLNCKEAGDPVCTHTMTGETEEELLAMRRSMAWKYTAIQRRIGMKRFQKTRTTLEVL